MAFDDEKVGQVVRNLLSNAIKFSPDDGAVIVATRDTMPSNLDGECAAVEISVSDQGPGILDDELDSVFDKFVQSRRKDKAAGGTGLGLAIAREVVRGHGGSIRAGNNPDQGSCFRVSLPRRPQ